MTDHPLLGLAVAVAIMLAWTLLALAAVLGNLLWDCVTR